MCVQFYNLLRLIFFGSSITILLSLKFYNMMEKGKLNNYKNKFLQKNELHLIYLRKNESRFFVNFLSLFYFYHDNKMNT